MFRLITKTGETRWIWQTCQAALDKQGNWLGRRASNRDITQYKENEKRLERREHLLKEAQHVAGIGHWEIDLQTGVLSCSDQIYRIFDLEPRQVEETFETFLAFVHPEDQGYLKRAHLNLLSKQKPYDLEYRLLLSNGLIKWVRSICSLEQSRVGNPLHALGTIHDITRLHDFDSALRQERAMFMNGPVIVFIWQNNSNWPVEHISGNVLEILGYSTEEFLDGSILYSSLIHPDDLARVTNEVRANSLPESTHFIHQPYRLIARDGRIVWVLDSTTLVRDAGGRISHYHGYLVDITHTILKIG